MQDFSKNKSSFSRYIFCFLTGICIIGTGGCQTREDKQKDPVNNQSGSITQLELKVDRLEKVIKENLIKSPTKKDRKIPTGKIKSITFRTGTEDDRLRIYWEDGTKSDLPCTKEQFIWACG